ncbi:hypothetical protein [uncultured Tenacibaculum sp.]|uniref:hypothetical protein n=1 Tax=uncultured Tenacibaculum sp. TaxID=174713 RepID=UPI0026229BAC|nr:hypothetical protein [uncultured Tenacibaculum sp.]
MIKSVSNLGSILNRKEQKFINGGSLSCSTDKQCAVAWNDPYAICHRGRCLPG